MKHSTILFFLLFCLGTLCGQPYHVGDLYTAPDGSQGVVFFVNPDGLGGWAVALNDASTGCQWGDMTDVPNLVNQTNAGLQLFQDTAGYSNTLILRTYQNNNSNYVAGVVDMANGWYVPSIGQLKMIHNLMPIISNAIVAAGGADLAYDIYWSSTESGYSRAWSLNFNDANTGSGAHLNEDKLELHPVRAVRSFRNTPTYLWNTGATTASITVSPTQPTTYTVTVSTAGGNSDSAQQTIMVYATSNTETTISACGSYEWNGQIYTESGDYSFFTPVEGGCNNVATLHLTISDQPEAIITSSAETICAGGEVTLDATSFTTHVPSVSIGDILCTDNSIVKPSDWPVAGKTAMGIVFYVDNACEHGWAVHLQDQTSGIQWGGYGSDISSLTNYTTPRDAIMDMNGYLNTQKIRAAGNATTYPAAYLVDFSNGWYLPAAGQLRILVSEIVTLNTSLQIVGGSQIPMNAGWWYWTSTEYGPNAAWYVTFYASLNTVNKNLTQGVRSVRDF